MALTGMAAACGAAGPSTEPSVGPTPSPGTGTEPRLGGRVLLAYFSRAGENYYYGGRTTLTVGNTEALAGMIADKIACDLYRIEAAEPYPDDYDETVDRSGREQRADARPAMAAPAPALDGYDVVLLGSGLWNVRPPMIMRTFVDELDTRGKTVLPVVTYAVSGMGAAAEVYEEACPGATIGEGIAVRGEEVDRAASAISSWLGRVGLR